MASDNLAGEPVIYTLSVQCVFGLYLEEDCIRAIEIADDATLVDLHYAIQDAVSFDDDHLYEFYAGRHYRNRKIEFTDSFEWDEVGEDLESVRLRDIYPLGSLKLYYMFDFGDSWTFEIRKSRNKPRPPEPGVTYPRVIERQGRDPEQYPSLDQ